MQPSSSRVHNETILAPVTDNSLNVASNIQYIAPTKKRKSSDLESDTALIDHVTGTRIEVFTARLLTSKGSLSFTPVTLVARACLPLAWLNPATSSQPLLLDASIPFVEEWEQRVFIVRKVPNGGLHAIEQVASNSYVAYALHNWVTEAWCHDAAKGKIAQVKLEDLLRPSEEGMCRGHSRTASASSSTALPTPKSPRRPQNRKGALARMSILAQDVAGGGQEVLDIVESPILTPQLVPTSAEQDISPRVQSPAVLSEPTVNPSLVHNLLPTTPAAQISAQDPFDNVLLQHNTITLPVQPVSAGQLPPALPIADANPLAPDRLRTQYFENLYTSKTSLAFYVKGPLSRARAHIRIAEDATKSITKLSEFYEQSILPMKKVDLKYKDSLAVVVKRLPAPDQGENGEGVETRKQKKSRSKKTKLGKDCLWPDEETFVAKWWRAREVKGTIAGSDHTEELRKELADLRMRETKMQMLLVLEIMLLEVAASKIAETNKPASFADPTVKVESIEADKSAAILAATPHRPLPKKKRNWPAEIDAIIDRLCIWHTVSFDGSMNIVDDKSAKKDANGSSTSKPMDALRDFCRDVLLPFYSVKIPEQIKSICRKLGGTEISPQRSKQARPAPALHRSSSSMSSLAKAKPGQLLSKRTLERVLSDDHRLLRHASPPTTFSRASSITAATIPALKREPSERPISRAGMLAKSSSFSNREIDLVADKVAHDMKRRKLDRLAQQKKELEAAIDALKKPDRKGVASQIMDEVEARKAQELEKKLAVQISATPRSKRFQPESQMVEEPELPPIPVPRLVARGPDAAMVIPSSTMKPQSMPDVPPTLRIPRSSATKRAVLAAIHETPSRGLVKKTFNPMAHPIASTSDTNAVVTATPARSHAKHQSERQALSEVHLPSSPSQPASSQVEAGGTGLRMRKSQRVVLFTPIKKSEAQLDKAFRDAPEIPEKAGRAMGRVMGGVGRGIDGYFEPMHSDHPLKLTSCELNQVVTDDNDIYDKLGWNDDFDL